MVKDMWTPGLCSYLSLLDISEQNHGHNIRLCGGHIAFHYALRFPDSFMRVPDSEARSTTPENTFLLIQSNGKMLFITRREGPPENLWSSV